MGISFTDFTGGGSGASNNGFYLYLGTSGNTNFELISAQPAGAYYIESVSSDTTYDIYAIASDGSLVGYTTNDRLIATDEFARVVVIGGTSDDVLRFDSRSTTFTTSKSDINDGAPAFITSVSVSDLESFDDTTTVVGGNFATNVEVYFVGTNDVDLAAKSIVRNSSSELVVARPDNLVPDYAPYDVKIINPGINLPSTAPGQHILSDAITAGAYPIWVTTSPLFWEQGETTSLTLVAQDAEGSDIDYSIISGSLLSNMTLDQETGVITVSDDGIYSTGDAASITVRATDTAGNTADASFDIFINSVPVYSFYFDPFVNAGALEKTLLFDMNLD